MGKPKLELEKAKPRDILDDLKTYESRTLRLAVAAMQGGDHDRAAVYRDRAKAAGKGLFLMRSTEEARDHEFTAHRGTMTLFQRCHKAGRVTHKVP